MDAGATQRPVLEAQGVVKQYRGLEVLRGVDLRVAGGEAVVLYGPNGAGKTTLLRVLATLLRPQAGRIMVDGIDADEREDARAKLLYSGHGTQLYDDLAPAENLRFACGLYGQAPTDDAIRGVLEAVGLWRFRDYPAATFSAGMKRRLGIARWMLVNPRLLLLDEPYTSLDAAGVALVNDFLNRFTAAGGAALLANHAPELTASLKHRVIRLQAGRILDGAAPHVA